MLVIVALMAIVLFGAAALAVDVSLQTHTRRTLQNWTDAAALAGARDLPGDATQAVSDALTVVQKNSPWSSSLTWVAQAPVLSCTPSRCVVTDYPGPLGFSEYLVSVSSPPAHPLNPAYSSSNYLEVDVSQRVSNALAGVIGQARSTDAGHSIAYNSGPPGPYQYTFFSKIRAGSGNQVETVVGDAYLGQGFAPQSSGKAGLCVKEIPGPEPNGDSDGDAGGEQDDDLDDQGHVVFATVPPSVGPEPEYDSPCPSGNAGGGIYVQQSAPQPTAPTNCPSGSTPQQGKSTWVCVQPTPAVPNVPAPTPTQPDWCDFTLKHASPPGVYPVAAGCAATLDFSVGDIDCVSLVLRSGSRVKIDNKKSEQYVTSYAFDPAADPQAVAAIGKLAGAHNPLPCPGASTHPEDRSVVWAPDPGAAACTSSSCPTAMSNGSTGCCSDTLFVGTVYLPNQEVLFATNQAMEDVGSVYVGDWEVQSGNHPNPIVTYDAAAAASVAPALRLVE